MKIKKITKLHLDKDVPVYCVNVNSNEIVVKSKNSDNSYVIGQCNFGLIFLGSEYTVKTTVIEAEWTKQEQLDFIKQNNLKVIVDKYGNDDIALTVARETRKRFFETYKQSETYLLKEVEQAKLRGYKQSFYGGIRRLPYLLYCEGRDDNRKRISNFESISVNSYIQNLESMIMLRIINKLCSWIKENNMKTKFVANIHDAIELYAYKPELEKLNEKLIELFNEYFDEYNGIKLSGEGNIADYYGGIDVIVKDKNDKTTIKRTYHQDNVLWDMGIDPKYYIDCYKQGKIAEKIDFE